MVKKIMVFLLGIYSISILSLFAADESRFTGIEGIENLTESQMKADWEELTPVLKEFILLVRAGKIYGFPPNEKGWKFDTVKLTKRFLSLSTEFDAKQFQEEIRTCADLFKIDAKKDPPSKKQIRSFLCKRKEKIELMSVYSFEDGKWIKVEEQKRTVPLNEKFDDTPKTPQ